MTLINFAPIHAMAVATGAKTRTIRRTARAKPGDRLQLYTGARTKAARKLCADVTCTGVSAVLIGDTEANCDDNLLRGAEADAFARLDGFACYADMAAFFRGMHGALPFAGYLHLWTYEGPHAG